MLAYASDLQTARRLDAVPEGAPELGRIIVKFKNAGIKTIARLSLYVDDVAATDLKHCAVESREVTETETDEEGNETTVVRNEKVDALWHDRSGHAWRSPFDPDAVEYCGELIAELAQGGVDAVLIDNVRFPNAGDGATDTALGFTVDATHWYRFVAKAVSDSAKWSLAVYDQGTSHPASSDANGTLVASLSDLAQANTTDTGKLSTLGFYGSGIAGTSPTVADDPSLGLADNVVVTKIPAAFVLTIR